VNRLDHCCGFCCCCCFGWGCGLPCCLGAAVCCWGALPRAAAAAAA
jgi:hypothetical protein